MGYGPWGRKESDRTERLSNATFSRSVHVAADGIASFFLWLSNIPSSLSIPLSVETSLLSMFSSVQLSRSVVSDSLRPHESQHPRPPCPSPIPGVHSCSGYCK